MKLFKDPKTLGILVLFLLGICLLSGLFMKGNKQTEGFVDSSNNIAEIKKDVKDIKQELEDDYPDMSKYALKTEVKPPQTCVVSRAVDKDNYIPKTEAEKMGECPVPKDYDPSKYISKAAASEPNVCPACPTLDKSKFVLKSTLPATQKCPDCKCPEVKVSAGLCQKCPPPPKCPPPKPCPACECPKPKPCPPQAPCPSCPPKEPCPVKICPACPTQPTPKECPKCCDRDVVKVLKKTVYVDQNGKTIKSEESLETPSKKESDMIKATQAPSSSGSNNSNLGSGSSNDALADYSTRSSSSNGATAGPTTRSPLLDNENAHKGYLPGAYGPQGNVVGGEALDKDPEVVSKMVPASSNSSSGTQVPQPTPTFSSTGSGSMGGSLNEQNNALGGGDYSNFPTSTTAPIIQSYKVNSSNSLNNNNNVSMMNNNSGANSNESCGKGAFNHEFKQFGIYGL